MKSQSNPTDRESISVSLVKILSVASVVLALLLGLAQLGSTVSYYAEVETSFNNRLEAGGVEVFLAAGVSGNEPSPLATLRALPTQGSTSFEVGINTEESTLPVLYQVRAFLNAQNPAGCEDLTLEATFGEYTYTGPLLNFLSPPMSESGWWSFTVSVPEGSSLAYNAICEGEVQVRVYAESTNETVEKVFTDEKTHSFTVQNVSFPLEQAATPLPPTGEEGTGSSSEAQTSSLIPEEEAPAPVVPEQEESQAEVLQNNETIMTDETLDPTMNQTPDEETPKEPAAPTE
ncbi:hypothetical protein H7X87_02260 [Acetobacteraceae bacterium]|nr:hypothetical protein [Candidatus Parcubacteria bacterium]